MKLENRGVFATSVALAGATLAAVSIVTFATGGTPSNAAYSGCGYGYAYEETGGYASYFGYGDCPVVPSVSVGATASESPSTSPSPTVSASPSVAPSVTPSTSPTATTSPTTSPAPTTSPTPACPQEMVASLKVLSNVHVANSKNGKVTLRGTVDPKAGAFRFDFYRRSGLTNKVAPAGSASVDKNTGFADRIINGKTGAIQRIYSVARAKPCFTDTYTNDVSYTIK